MHPSLPPRRRLAWSKPSKTIRHPRRRNTAHSTKSKNPSLPCGSAKPRMKSFARCCTRAPASRYHTRPWLATAARCWTQPGPRSPAAPRRQQSNRPHQLPLNRLHNHRLATEGHADRASLILRICSTTSAGVASRGDQRATIKQPAHPRSKSLSGSKSATNARSQPCNARSSRTDKEKRSRALLPSVIGSAAPGARLRSSQLRRLPAAFRRQRQTEA